MWLTIFAWSSKDALGRGKFFFTWLAFLDDCPPSSPCATLISLSTLATCSACWCFFFVLATAASFFLSFSAVTSDGGLWDFGRSTAPGLFVVWVFRDGGRIFTISESNRWGDYTCYGGVWVRSHKSHGDLSLWYIDLLCISWNQSKFASFFCQLLFSPASYVTHQHFSFRAALLALTPSRYNNFFFLLTSPSLVHDWLLQGSLPAWLVQHDLLKKLCPGTCCRVLGGLGSLMGSEVKLTGSLIQKYKQADLFLSKGNSTTNSSGPVGFPTFPADDLMSLWGGLCHSSSVWGSEIYFTWDFCNRGLA